jgi:hypothetical protein
MFCGNCNTFIGDDDDDTTIKYNVCCLNCNRYYCEFCCLRVSGIRCHKGNIDLLIQSPWNVYSEYYDNIKFLYVPDDTTTFDFASCKYCTKEKENIYVSIEDKYNYLLKKFDLKDKEIIEETKTDMINQRNNNNGSLTKPSYST